MNSDCFCCQNPSVQAALYAQSWKDPYFYVTPGICLAFTGLIAVGTAFAIYKGQHLKVCSTIMGLWSPLSKTQKAGCIAVASVGCLYLTVMVTALKICCMGDKGGLAKTRRSLTPSIASDNTGVDDLPPPFNRYQEPIYSDAARLSSLQICCSLIDQELFGGPEESDSIKITYSEWIQQQHKDLAVLLQYINNEELSNEIYRMIDACREEIKEASDLEVLQQLQQRYSESQRTEKIRFSQQLEQREQETIQAFHNDDVLRGLKQCIRCHQRAVPQLCGEIECRVNQNIELIKTEDPILLGSLNENNEPIMYRSVIDWLIAVQGEIADGVLSLKEPEEMGDGVFQQGVDIGQQQEQVMFVEEESLWKLYAILWCRKLGIQMAAAMASMTSSSNTDTKYLRMDIEQMVALNEKGMEILDVLYSGSGFYEVVTSYVSPVFEHIRGMQKRGDSDSESQKSLQEWTARCKEALEACIGQAEQLNTQLEVAKPNLVDDDTDDDTDDSYRIQDIWHKALTQQQTYLMEALNALQQQLTPGDAV